MMSKKENYAPPQVKVVKFKVELGAHTSETGNGSKSFVLEPTGERKDVNNSYVFNDGNDWGTL